MAMTYPTVTGEASTTTPLVLFFGPQYTHFTEKRLLELRKFIVGNTDLKPLLVAIKELPSLWPSLQQACLHLNSIPGAEQLDQLCQIFEAGTLPKVAGLNNLLLTPLTVISQIVEILCLGEKTESLTFPASFQADSEIGSVQGFCVGFLAAAAVASSRDKTEFQHYSSVALRLAVCIGSTVDRDEGTFLDPLDRSSSIAVRWKTDLEQAYFKRTLSSYSMAYISCVTDENSVTVTIPVGDASSFAVQVSEGGLSWQSIGLHGRFHHPVHSAAVQSLKDFCKRDKRFQFLNAGLTALPIRSGTTSDLITRGFLHDIALDSILTEQFQWFQTARATVAGIGSKKVKIMTVGAGSFMPRSIAAELNSESIGPQIPKEKAHAQVMPHQLSSHSEPTKQSDLNTADTPVPESAIAVVGMACRFPEADSPERFWQLIESGLCAVQQLPKDRFDTSDLWRDPKGPFFGNFLRDPDAFDNQFFGIPGREAKSMDPQQRLLLQVAYEAMESSGYFGLQSDEKTSDIGCYVGVGAVDYGDNVASHNATAFSATGTLRAFISGKVSHYFGWSGPSITYDTACSSSAVAIHAACKALQTRECSMAIAGGVNVMTSPALFQNLAAASFLSPTGPSRAFDANANGYCRGEGAGLVVLKPLERAIADGDPVLGVIVGSAVNQGSNCTPITVPVSESQEALYRRALFASGMDPAEVSYVEAHGTGTPVGDPIEWESICQTFGGANRTEELFLGSVKDNIGHAEAASGVAALLKVLLMIQNRTIPKQANFESLSPRISSSIFNRMSVPRRSQSWTPRKLSAVINNYGAAGSNAAIVLQEHAASDGNKVDNDRASANVGVPEYPFFISAKSPESLASYCAALQSFVARTRERHACDDALASLSYNLARKQNHAFKYSWISTASTLTNLSDQLAAVGAAPKNITKKADPILPVVLCFAGQTGKTVNLSEELFYNCRSLQVHLAECDSICQVLGLPSLFPRIFRAEPIEDVVSLHCILFSVQYACAKSWLDCGLKVETLIGHSFGQLTALCVADCLSLSDGMRLISTRARLIRDQWGSETGVMLSVEGDRQDVETLLANTKKQHGSCTADIACYNGPRHYVLAGSRASIEAIEEESGSEELATRFRISRLKNTHAFHSRLADSILLGLGEMADTLNFKEPSIRIETCSTDRSWSKIGPQEILQHTRMPVYFSQAVERISQRQKHSLWLEAGSGSSIVAMARRVLKDDPEARHIFQPVDLGSSGAQNSLAKASCQLWAAGSKSHFWPFHAPTQDRFSWMNLPPYQFEKTRHWIEYKPSVKFVTEAAKLDIQRQSQLVELVGNENGDGDEALFSVDSTNEFFELGTRGHAVLHHSLCPASMYFELAVRAVKLLGKEKSSRTVPHIQDLTISSPLGLSPAGGLFLLLSRDKLRDETWKFSVSSGGSQDAPARTVHASGNIALLASDDATTASRIQSLNRLIKTSRCEQIMDSPDATGLQGKMIYKTFSSVVDYADYYRGVKRVFAKDQEVVGHVSVPNDQPSKLTRGCCDPIALDNFLRVAGIHVNCLADRKDDEVFVCTAIGELLLSKNFSRNETEERSWTVYSNFDYISKKGVVNDILVLDPRSGELVLALLGAHFTSIPFKFLERSLAKLNGVHKSQDLDINTAQIEASPEFDEAFQLPSYIEASTSQDTPKTNDLVPSRDEDQSDQVQLLKRVQNMISEVVEIPISDIQPDSALADLGIDSLMITEVLGEIKTRFKVTVSAAEFQELTDLQSLIHRIQQSSSSQMLNGVGLASSGERPNLLPSVKTQVSDRLGRIVFDDETHKTFAYISRDCFNGAKTTFDSIAQDNRFIGFCHMVYRAQAELVVAYVVEAFNSLGCPLASLGPSHRLPEVHYSSQHTKVMGQLHKILEDADLITRRAGVMQRTEKSCPATTAKVLQAALVKKYPQHASEHELLHTTGHNLADCLTGRLDPLSLLFRDAKARSLLEEVYTNAPMFKSGTVFLVQYLISIFRQFDSEREIKILEIGAGTGGTTSYLIELLSMCKQKFQYTFTDLSTSMVGAAKKKFAKHSFMRYAVLNVEQAPPPPHLNQYDIVISSNCIHATRDLTKSCTNIKNMLRLDGILCLVELTRNLFWFDLVFGLLEGWWLFEDGREHVLANESLWDECLRRAGFQWIDWTEGDSEESRILRVIAASPSKELPSVRLGTSTGPRKPEQSEETVLFKQEGNTQLLADIYYPEELDEPNLSRPVALMIHGGGHVMLSRKDIRPKQTKMLLDAGFLPVSVDYRLCPETTLLEGPMRDVCDALKWARNTLPKLSLKRPDIRANGSQVVAIGWSTGGHLAMTLAWTAPAQGIEAPQAILSFYSPTDYEDPFWTRPNIPHGAEHAASEAESHDDGIRSLSEGTYDKPITAYNIPPGTRSIGGWLATSDPRSKIALHMNRNAQTLPVLLHGPAAVTAAHSKDDVATPTREQIASVSPLAHIRQGKYRTPTFIVHGTLDDLIPWQQSQRTHATLVEKGVEAELRVVEGAVHLFDVYHGFERDEGAGGAVSDGYRFLCRWVGLA